MKKKATILAVLILAVAVILLLLYFFPPGNEAIPIFVPRADRSAVGDTVTLSVEKMVEDGQFLFVYIYDPRKDSGRLAVFGGESQNLSVCPVTIYEPQWSGGDGLCKAITGEFEAEIVEVVNIGFIESMHFSASVHVSESELSRFNPGEVIDIFDFQGMDSGNSIQYYFGKLSAESQDSVWVALTENVCMTLTGSTESQCSDMLSSAIEKLNSIAGRYWLKGKLGL